MNSSSCPNMCRHAVQPRSSVLAHGWGHWICAEHCCALSRLLEGQAASCQCGTYAGRRSRMQKSCTPCCLPLVGHAGTTENWSGPRWWGIAKDLAAVAGMAVSGG